MNKSEQKSLYVLQFRTDQSELHDRKCIAQSFKDLDISLTFFNMINKEHPENLDNAIGIILSGSGEFFVGKGDGKDSWMVEAHTLVDEALEKDIPILGLCFGSQILGVHQGGEIVSDEKLRESGTYTISKTAHAKEDPLFCSLPEEFTAILGHKETVVNLPEHVTILASSEKVGAQAIRVKNKHAWAVLFHPELTKQTLLDRFMMYPDYLISQSIEEAAESLLDTPHAPRLMHAFGEFTLAHAKKH